MGIGTMVHSDITTDEEVGSGKITSRRNSSKESRDGKSRVHGNSQTSHDSKSILDTESDTVGSNSDSDSPRKHSIFDIDIDDGKTDMYDKIKARREAYMKKQEEERHQKELKKAKMMKLKEQQRLRKEKKALAAQARDTSDSEEEASENRGQKRNKAKNSSSEDDPNIPATKKHRAPAISSDDSDAISM